MGVLVVCELVEGDEGDDDDFPSSFPLFVVGDAHRPHGIVKSCQCCGGEWGMRVDVMSVAMRVRAFYAI